MRALKRRFYDEVTVRDGPAVLRSRFDGRPIRTPARHALAAPCRPLGEAIAAEWRAQTEFIDPAAMAMTRLANTITIIDGVAAAQDEVAGEIVKYLGSDLVCYRAGDAQGLVARQSRHWDPILAWAKAALGAEFATVQGITHLRQPGDAIAHASAAIPRDPWRLGAAHANHHADGLGVDRPRAGARRRRARRCLDCGPMWTRTGIMELWGRDELGLKRRAYRFAEMDAAAKSAGGDRFVNERIKVCHAPRNRMFPISLA